MTYLAQTYNIVSVPDFSISTCYCPQQIPPALQLTVLHYLSCPSASTVNVRKCPDHKATLQKT